MAAAGEATHKRVRPAESDQRDQGEPARSMSMYGGLGRRIRRPGPTLKAPSKPSPVLAASLRKWSLPEMAACVLGDELGKGSTGVVRRASLGDGETLVQVAVKILREATSGCALGR